MYQSPSHHFSTYIHCFFVFFFTKCCKENPWTINVHNPSTKCVPFARCGWRSIYWSAGGYRTSCCMNEVTILYWFTIKKKKKQHIGFEVLTAVACVEWQQEGNANRRVLKNDKRPTMMRQLLCSSSTSSDKWSRLEI